MKGLAPFLILVLLCACTKKITERITPRTSAEEGAQEIAFDYSSPDKIRAEKLVTAAEAMLTPIGFFYADEVLEEALKIDPDNRKAQFYRAFIAPMMKFRGFINKMAELKHRLHSPDLIKSLDNYGSSPGDLSRFLKEGGEPWQNEGDVQRFLTEVMEEQNKLTTFLKANKNFVTRISKFQIYEYNKFISQCAVRKVSEGTYRVDPCPYVVRVPVHANRADWEALLQTWNGMRILTATLVSYELDGYLENFRNQRALADQPNFGLLFENHRLREVLDLGAEILGGLQWLYSMRERLCPNGASRNSHLLEEQVCFRRNVTSGRAEFAMASALNVLDLSLKAAGGTLQFTKPLESRLTGQNISAVELDLMALFKRPVADLKTLWPSSYDDCDRPLAFRDPTLGGVYKSGNAHLFLLGRGKCDETNR